MSGIPLIYWDFFLFMPFIFCSRPIHCNSIVEHVDFFILFRRLLSDFSAELAFKVTDYFSL